MEDIRQITCGSCSDVAVEYDNETTCLSKLDGEVRVCQSCSVLGRVWADYEYQRMSCGFSPLKKEEISHVDFGLLVEAYEAAQSKIEQLYDDIHQLRIRNKELQLLARAVNEVVPEHILDEVVRHKEKLR